MQPIFRGEITSIHLIDQGVGYGSSEVINFNRQPQVTLVSGKEAQLQPVVVNGSITEVVVMSKGQKYNAAPTLTLLGDGIGAVITPVFENNELTDVKVIHGGNGYALEYPISRVLCDSRILNIFEILIFSYFI